MQAAGDTFDKQVVLDTAGTVGAVTANMAGSDLGADHLVIASTLRRRLDEPGMKAASRDTERSAHPCHRPDPSVLRDEGEPHIESFAKQAAASYFECRAPPSTWLLRDGVERSPAARASSGRARGMRAPAKRQTPSHICAARSRAHPDHAPPAQL